MTDFSDDEAFAAEYVLGTLDGSERATAELRRRTEPPFATLVNAWEARLAPLSIAAADVAAPPALLQGILARLPAQHVAVSGDNVVVLRRSLRVWRGVAALTSALAAVLALWIVQRDTLAPPSASQTYVAVLQHGADTPSFVMSLDLADHRMAVMPLAVNAPPGKSYELWMIGADKAAPRSMGIIDPHAMRRSALPDVDKAVLSDATYAVTLEREGGSPTGRPTSTPLFAGKLIQTAL